MKSPHNQPASAPPVGMPGSATPAGRPQSHPGVRRLSGSRPRPPLRPDTLGGTLAAGLRPCTGAPEPAGTGSALAHAGWAGWAWMTAPASGPRTACQTSPGWRLGLDRSGTVKRKKARHFPLSASPVVPSPTHNSRRSWMTAATPMTHGGRNWRNGRRLHGADGPTPIIPRRSFPSTKPWPMPADWMPG
ncbi:MAG: hypothetical protein H6R26_2104 [Proteobacteria bacterium]|nr:hypothetical protein [Pseudomonadota bacterium]